MLSRLQEARVPEHETAARLEASEQVVDGEPEERALVDAADHTHSARVDWVAVAEFVDKKHEVLVDSALLLGPKKTHSGLHSQSVLKLMAQHSVKL